MEQRTIRRRMDDGEFFHVTPAQAGSTLDLDSRWCLP